MSREQAFRSRFRGDTYSEERPEVVPPTPPIQPFVLTAGETVICCCLEEETRCLFADLCNNVKRGVRRRKFTASNFRLQKVAHEASSKHWCRLCVSSRRKQTENSSEFMITTMTWFSCVYSSTVWRLFWFSSDSLVLDPVFIFTCCHTVPPPWRLGLICLSSKKRTYFNILISRKSWQGTDDILEPSCWDSRYETWTFSASMCRTRK